MEPPDVPTTTVEVPTVKVAPAVDVSMERIVIEELPADRVPVAERVRLDPPVMLLFDVVRLPVMLKVLLTSMALFCVIVPLIVKL